MDLEAARKSLSQRSALSSKRVAFLAVAGLCLAVGVFLRAGPYFNQPAVEENAPVASEAPAPAAPPVVGTTDSVPKLPTDPQGTATAPSEPAKPAGAADVPPAPESATVEQKDQPVPPELPGAGMILVAKRPVEVLAGPSPDASAMFGFPAGRPFRVIGREGGFARIQDLKSGASGWIDEAALAPPPPLITAPSQSKSGAVRGKPATASADPKSKATGSRGIKKETKVAPGVAAETESAQPQKRPGLFGRGGLFGGIFGGGNQP